MTIDVEKVRRDFPYLEETLYLNTAAIGLSWSGQGAAAARYYDQMQMRGSDGREEWSAVASRVQSQLARLMAVEPDEVGFVGSTTEALNLVFQALPIEPGDRVVFADDEFPSMKLALEALRFKGTQAHPIPIKEEPRRTDLLCKAATGARVVGVSHVHWATGSRVDLHQLAGRCREEGAWLIVDGIQALGAIPVDAAASDVYAASVFKWLLSGFGLGVVVIRKPLREQLAPAFRGYSNPPPSTDVTYGHINYPGLYVLEATLAYLERLGWDSIFQRTSALRDLLFERLSELGVEIATPKDHTAGIISVRTRDSAELIMRLYQQGVRVVARDDLMRISPHFYNTEGEIDRFCKIFSATLKRSIS